MIGHTFIYLWLETVANRCNFDIRMRIDNQILASFNLMIYYFFNQVNLHSYRWQLEVEMSKYRAALIGYNGMRFRVVSIRRFLVQLLHTGDIY